MKIDSFEIKHNQYLSIVVSGTKHQAIYNLKSYKTTIIINDKKTEVRLFSVYRDTENEVIEANFDLSPIVDAFMLANLEK